jgi:tetratricopeptide (TPR) repeat protein
MQNMMEMSVKDFFISYNRADRSWAEWIAWQLEEASYSTIIQAWDFRPGSNFVEEMQRATAEAKRTIAVVSPDFLSSEFARSEWNAAFADDPLGNEGKLVPVKVRDCKLDGLRKAIIYIDLTRSDEEAARDELIRGLNRDDRAKPDKEPRFPGRSTKTTYKPQFPGSLPEVWNIPLSRNHNFTGREQILAELRTPLDSSQQGVCKQAIWGMAGVGKTQIVTEYAYRNIDRYKAVWWIRSEEPAILASDYAALSERIGVLRDEKDQTKTIEAVRRWLEYNRGWLLIFDNAVRAEDIERYLPRVGYGHVIITSRDPVWGGIAKPMEIEVFDRPESIQLIQNRTKQHDGSDDLADAMGDLPLALDQASAYIEEKAVSIPDYLDRFRKHKSKTLERGRSATYQSTMGAALDVACQAVEERSEAAIQFLWICSFLAPEKIPRSLFVEGSEQLPEPLASAAKDELEFDEVIAALRGYSLINADAKGISVHRLVQLLTRERMSEEDRRKWAEISVKLVDEAFPEKSDVDVRAWAACAVLLPHVLDCIGYAEELGSVITGSLRNNAGDYLFGQNEFQEAKILFESALKIDEQVYGQDYVDVARDVNSLGSVLLELDELQEARKCFERALKISEQVYGPDHVDVAKYVNNLGFVLKDLDELQESRKCFERAIKISEQVYGPDHIDVAKYVNNLGLVLSDLGELQKARKCFERALSIDEQVYGPDHTDVARDVNNLGLVLRDLGELQEARKCFERALSIDERVYGPDHTDVAKAVNNLGYVLKDLGELQEARECVEQALRIDEQVYGPDHTEVARDVNNLGLVLRDLGDRLGAKKQIRRALKIYEKALGPNHTKTKIIRKNLRGLG